MLEIQRAYELKFLFFCVVDNTILSIWREFRGDWIIFAQLDVDSFHRFAMRRMQSALKRRRQKRRKSGPLRRISKVDCFLRARRARSKSPSTRTNLVHAHSNLNKKRVGPWQIDWSTGVIPILCVAGY